MGDNGALVIMDVWLKWLIAKPKNNQLYWLGAWLLRIPFFPKIFHSLISNSYRKSKKKRNWAFRRLETILDNSVYLVLDLKENIDFSFDDVDEAKQLFKFSTKYVESVFAHDSDVNNHQVEYWNMHTFSNKVIETSKLSLLKINESYSANDILLNMINTNIQYVKDNCLYLVEYLNYITTKKVLDNQ
jgi:hypothetical protein